MAKQPWRNRIVKSGEVEVEQLLAHENNWKIHPRPQADAFLGAAKDVGFVDRVLINMRASADWPPGKRNVETLIDGHMRVGEALSVGQPTLPADWVDLTPWEEAYVLKTLDVIGSMWGVDNDKWNELMSGMQYENPAVSAALAQMSQGGDDRHIFDTGDATGGDLESMLAQQQEAGSDDEGDDEAMADPDDPGEEGGRDSTPPALGDYLWPSANEWDIPDLLPGMQAIGVDMPVNRWGAEARTARFNGTYHFYTDDYRFTGLWKNPRLVVESGCKAAIEPNYSTSDMTPKSVVLWGIYRKRWLARYWQANGIRIFVDLAIDPKFRDINLLGVPRGWRAYATYIYETEHKDHPTWLQTDFEIACEHAGTDALLFLVYGGGKEVEQICKERSWFYVPGHQQAYFRIIAPNKIRK